MENTFWFVFMFLVFFSFCLRNIQKQNGMPVLATCFYSQAYILIIQDCPESMQYVIKSIFQVSPENSHCMPIYNNTSSISTVKVSFSATILV